MRIIAGKYKGRKINRVNTPLTREAQDKVRGAIFNSLYTDVIDARVLDLFGGSGSYGIEALSRGAKEVVMIDQQLKAIETMKSNIKLLDINPGVVSLISDDYKNAMNQLINNGSKFDIIFIDAPYDLVIDKNDFIGIDKLTHEKSILVYEMDKDVIFEDDVIKPFVKLREKKYGIKKVVYYVKS